MQHLLL